MKVLIQDFLLMLQFFTRLPINLNLTCEKENFKRGTMFFPLIGLTTGFIQWITYFLAIKVLPDSTTALFVLLIGILVTGALHIDGLGDVFDGFFAFKGKDKIIEIMKDSRIGTYSCIAIIMDLAFRYNSYINLINKEFSLGIIAAPVVARTIFVLLFYMGKQAKKVGTGNLFIGNVSKKELVVSCLLGAVITGLLLGLTKALVITAAAVIATLLFNKYCEGKIGGLTGDTLGANNEFVEVITLILAYSIKL
ncbi:adenosylcobinamide-GDP ribazoletransferase [Clostridium bovifaecis]|uniref:Adenosylcobinamide-GDP ribazoletransferase n=1 Tax=Clostridium bovifaecis TaxID=2184719 RepID=A0A6I6F9M3_9CLOT|nr:adenosylcobinamide-GDP ribazoletransferase [Clostridium bovifaecis]